MSILETALRDALAPEAEPIAPVAREVAVVSLPPISIDSMPAPRLWRHRLLRDATTGLLVEVLSEPVEETP